MSGHDTRESGAYLPGVDGLRAIAVLSVMVYHLKPSWLPGGFVGVDVFFVISGYVVTGSLVRVGADGFWRYLLDFYSRRFRRILPALFVCLAASIAFVIAFVPNAWLSDAIPGTSLAAFVGMSNFALLASSDGYFAPNAEFNPFTHTWSLAVEEQFYLLYPVLLYAGLRAAGTRARLRFRAVFAVLLLGSLAWCALLSQRKPSHAYFMLDTRYWELACGGGLLLAREWLARQAPTWLSPGRLMVGGGLALAASMAFADTKAFPFPWAVPAVVGALCVISGIAWAGSAPRGLAAWLASPPMVAVGLRSYSLYLWHWPVFAAFRWTLGLDTAGSQTAAVMLTLLAASASYAWIERPVKVHRGLAGLLPMKVVGAGIAVMAIGYVGAQALYAHQSRLSQSVVMRGEAAWYPHPSLRVSPVVLARCLVTFTSQRVSEFGRIQEFVPRQCREPALAAGRLFVVGDSHASAYRRLFHMFSEESGVPISMYPAGGCPVASLLEPGVLRPALCAEFEGWALQQLANRVQPGDVVLLASLRMRRLDASIAMATPASIDAAEQAYREAAAIVERLTALGAQVVIDAPKPVFPSPAFRCSDWFNATNPACAGGTSMRRDILETRRAGVMGALERLRQTYSSVSVWDPLPVLCPGAVCEAVQQGQPLFFDGDHLSGLANEVLLPSFRTHLLPRLGAARTGSQTSGS